MLDKADAALKKAICALEDITDSEESLILSKELSKESLNILERHQKLTVQETARTV
ncbi:hypothetical protein [uncultured Acinetobacter sp.]|uniref:hypothetical protein n=1 Tax=uncultured Acinetobacter sp. TaxID=165433 RepID=UPI00261A6AA3|nr:hypothetical protein [uncultured Acinetobacter sp.]